MTVRFHQFRANTQKPQSWPLQNYILEWSISVIYDCMNNILQSLRWNRGGGGGGDGNNIKHYHYIVFIMQREAGENVMPVSVS